jgi:hypothetical protein
MKGASTVKWTTLDLCIGFSESDSRQYNNYEICEGKKSHKHFQSILNHISQAISIGKNILKKNLHSLEDGASGHIEQVIPIFCLKYDKTTLN